MSSISPSHRPATRRVRLLGAVAALLMVPATWTPAAADLDTWYPVPSYKGVKASAIMSDLQSNLGSGSAWGQISVRNTSTPGRFYVKFKPDPRGPGGWNRGTQNYRLGTQGTDPWEDDFVVYTTGYKFKICKVRRGPDPCGSAVLIEARNMGGG